MMLFSPRLNTVFASRWKALAWAASVMLSAYCSIPSQEETKQQQAGASQQADASQASIENLLSPAEQPTQTKSPWALDSPAGGKAAQPAR